MKPGAPRLGSKRTHVSLVLIASLVVAMLASTAGLAAAQADSLTDRSTPGSAQHPEVLRLACAPDSINGQRGVLCKWSEATNPNTRAYRLYKSTDGSARELVTTVRADGRLGYFDTNVSAPSTLVYGVVSINRNGRVLGQSAPAEVTYGHDIQALRLACAPDFIEGHRGVLCRWSAATQPSVRGYLLYRVADTDARELIARVGADGRLGFFDTDVTPGATYTYGVTAINDAGAVIAIGGPRQVRWPAAD